MCEDLGKDVEWMETGPGLLRYSYAFCNLKSFAKTKEVFDVIRGGGALFQDADVDLEDAYSVHMYNSGLMIGGKDKNGVYPENSTFEKLKRKYL